VARITHTFLQCGGYFEPCNDRIISDVGVLTHPTAEVNSDPVTDLSGMADAVLLMHA